MDLISLSKVETVGMGTPEAAARWGDGKLADTGDLAIIDKVFRQQHGTGY